MALTLTCFKCMLFFFILPFEASCLVSNSSRVAPVTPCLTFVLEETSSSAGVQRYFNVFCLCASLPSQEDQPGRGATKTLEEASGGEEVLVKMCPWSWPFWCLKIEPRSRPVELEGLSVAISKSQTRRNRSHRLTDLQKKVPCRYKRGECSMPLMSGSKSRWMCDVAGGRVSI